MAGIFSPDCHLAQTKQNNKLTEDITMKTNSLLKKIAYALFVVATTAAVHAADVSGDWTWNTPGRNGGPDRTSTLTLKVDGSTLTGKVSTPGRDGKNIDTPIADGKVDGDNISFIVVRQNQGQSITNNYSGTIATDQITGKIEFTRDGNQQSRDWTAKRATLTK
jgi:hypothetical protein